MAEFWEDWKGNTINRTFLLEDASDSFKIDIKPCQYVYGQNLMRDSDGQGMIDVVCSDVFAEHLQSQLQKRVIEKGLEWYDWQSDAIFNDWKTMLPIEWSFELLCAGLETRQPQFSFDSDGFSILVGLSKSRPTNVDHYCDANKFQLNDTHPNLIAKYNHSRQNL